MIEKNENFSKGVYNLSMKNSADCHKRNTRGTKRREEILEKAVEVFSEHGRDGATLRLVSRRAGINISTLMYYFPSKEILFAEVVGMVDKSELYIVEKWRESLTDLQLSQIDNLKEALTELGIMIIDRGIEDPSRIRVGIFSALNNSDSDEFIPAGVVTTPSPEKEVVRAVLTRAVELGTIKCTPQEIEDYIEGYTYISRGFTITHINEIAMGSKNRDAIIRRFRKFIYRYINNMLPDNQE
ncbi:MAG: TetR/AcrR family transcriptional regulator [Anaerolineaceae bacterium]|nr:TetR/AcrR family transcriptional regulator [Anaerolineaceae bacterium]